MEFGPIFRSLLRNRARVVVIVAEVALTLAIVANCMSLILDTRAQLARESGFDDEHIACIQSNPFAESLNQQKALGAALAYALNFGMVTWVSGARLSLPVVAVGAAGLWLIGIASALGPALRGAQVPPAIATRNV